MRLLLGLLLISNLLFSQTPSIHIIGGNDTTICDSIYLDLHCVLDTNTYSTNSYQVTQIPYNPYPYNVGTLYNIPIDDVWSGIINLPFNFCYFGQTYNKYVISTNGVISFNLSYANNFSPWSFNALIPTNVANFPRPMMGLYHDIDPSIGGVVRYGVIGTSPYRKLIISFFQVPHFQCNNLISTFQIILHEFTNIIEIHVEKKQTCNTWNGGRACLGIQNPLGNIGYPAPGRNTGVYTINTPEAWRFSPNGPSNLPQWYVNGLFINSGFNLFENNILAPSTINVTYQYLCPLFQVEDTLNIYEFQCCDPLNIDIFTN